MITSIENELFTNLSTMQASSKQCETGLIADDEGLIYDESCLNQAMWTVTAYCETCPYKEVVNMCDTCRMNFVIFIGESRAHKTSNCTNCNADTMIVTYTPIMS